MSRNAPKIHHSSSTTMATGPMIDLRGEWLIRRDHGNVGLAEHWEREPIRTPPWRPTTLPGPWQRSTDFGPEYHYVGWYRRTVRLPDDWKWSRTHLRFEAVATATEVWVNATRVGSHVGDFIPFEFEVTEAIGTAGEIDLCIRVDETLGHITKGFHDMLSLHYGGLWRPVSLVGSGPLHARPNRVWIHGDPDSNDARTIVELARPAECEGRLRVRIKDAADQVVGVRDARIDRGASLAQLNINLPDARRWSPATPTLYTASIEVHANGSVSDARRFRFGFRSIRTEDRRIYLNDCPIHLRGVLHWGHEPRWIAPAAPPTQLRSEFARLRAMGFNTICMCMWYAPRYFYEIADEMGMLIWQEHPVWHSPMSDDLLPEYRRLYGEFMRRDRAHPSVIIASATCEHPEFHPQLAHWWWKTAHEMLPERLLQVQTAFFAWQNPDHTDLYDEHTYDNNDRWITYLEDVQDALADLEPKPFVMGESVLFTSWPDFGEIEARDGAEAWWRPSFYEHGRTLEQKWNARYGAETVARFRRQADRAHLLGRQFQIERFRSYANHAGLVMNHLRDVPGCVCGFMDDFDRWRFAPEQTRGWLGDAPLILITPDHRRSFAAGEVVDCAIRCSNFSPDTIDQRLSIRVDGQELTAETLLKCRPGETEDAPFELSLPTVGLPTKVSVEAGGSRLDKNRWDVWVMPDETSCADAWDGVFRLTGRPFDDRDAEPDEFERGYSHGYGLPAKSWSIRLPDPERLAPEARPWNPDDAPPSGARVLLTHKLTSSAIDWLAQGGRLILFASKTRGGLGSSYEWLFGQCPLVVETGPLTSGDSEWIVDLLNLDLARHYARVMRVEELGIVDSVEPLIRLAYTHDQSRVRLFDRLFMTQVESGLLIVSALDHDEPAGQYLLRRLIAFARRDDAASSGRLSIDRLRSFAVE